MKETEWISRYLEIDGRGVAINLPGGFNALSFYFLEYFDESQLRSSKLLCRLRKSIFPKELVCTAFGPTMSTKRAVPIL